MDKFQVFDHCVFRNMAIDDLIAKCKQYVAQYYSKSAATRLAKAYRALKYEEVKSILGTTLELMKTQFQIADYQNANKVLKSMFPYSKKRFVSSDNSEGSSDGTMSISSGTVAIILVIVAILVIAAICSYNYLKNQNFKEEYTKKTVGEVLVDKPYNENNNRYTDKDRDLLFLIGELSIVYSNTDEYLHN